MLANAQPVGIDQLGQLAGVAAVRAIAHLGAAVALVRCDEAGIDAELAVRDIRFEAWLVRESDVDTTIAAFATVREPAGNERIAASGRFTFSLLPIEKGPSA